MLIFPIRVGNEMCVKLPWLFLESKMTVVYIEELVLL